MTRFAHRLSLALTVLAPAMLGAQAAAPAPTYNLLTVYRETVKPGKNLAHDAHESAWARAMTAAKPANGYLALTALSGASENWYISAYDSWAAYEAANKAGEANAAAMAVTKEYTEKEGEYLNDGRGMVLSFRADMSYGGPSDLAASRYFSVTRVSVRPGQGDAYEANRKATKAAHETAKLTDSYSVWQAIAGAPAGTYYTFVARKSLAEIDGAEALHNAPAYVAALGGAEGRAKLMATATAAVISTQTDQFAFAPQQSIPPAAWVTADPGFWKHKAPAGKKAP